MKKIFFVLFCCFNVHAAEINESNEPCTQDLSEENEGYKFKISQELYKVLAKPDFEAFKKIVEAGADLGDLSVNELEGWQKCYSAPINYIISKLDFCSLMQVMIWVEKHYDQQCWRANCHKEILDNATAALDMLRFLKDFIEKKQNE